MLEDNMAERIELVKEILELQQLINTMLEELDEIELTVKADPLEYMLEGQIEDLLFDISEAEIELEYKEAALYDLSI